MAEPPRREPDHLRDPQPHVLSIGALAAATGMSVPALRAWEERYGFPAPHRTQEGGGHRRYSARDITTIRRVLERQAAGTGVREAVDAALAERERGVLLSVHGEVSAAHPGLPRTTLAKPAVLALSRAIEDEVVLSGAGGHLFGGFQTVRHHAASRARWQELAGLVASAHAFAQPDHSDHSDHSGWSDDEVVLVDLPPGVPLTREWLLVHDGPALATALLARERPDDGPRTFEVVWTVDPAVVRTAARRCAAAASAAGSERATALLAGALSDPRRTPPSGRWATERLLQGVASRLARG
ncbi:MerR family transcriptional regulator [Nocardioides anomalus]|uniref:MerR family transcriptional regulator n=1 Tax=Nocardioides anomalus TaxID=2712223 RepID=A0A6G6WC79_9ACTN|nr:DICT sensory domain-containing protein [Nocardioides anomalus]QIG42834.1 MerR family transcriptional regulator [Nocardioides anomalus]